MRLLTLVFFRYLRGTFGNGTLYTLGNKILLECSAVKQFCFMAPELLFVYETLGDDTAYPLQAEQQGMSSAEMLEVDDERNVLREEASSGVNLYLENGLYLLEGRGEQPVRNAKEVGSKMRKLSSSVMSVEKKRRNTARRRESGEKDGVRGAESKEVEVTVDEKKKTMTTEKVETKNVKEMKRERTKVVETQSSNECEQGKVKRWEQIAVKRWEESW